MYDAYEKVTIGLPVSRESRSEETIKLVAYHEMGHALICALFKDMFNLQKITINSNRNGAGGYTLFTPVNVYNEFPTKKFMLANMIIAMGGRAAEVIIYGGAPGNMEHINYNPKLVFADLNNLDVTSGASNDLKQVHSIARRYVSLFGLGKNIGLYDSSDGSQPFLGRDIAMNTNKLSEYSKEEIDKEIESLVQYAHETAVNILIRNNKLFRTMTEKLILERTISGEELYDVAIEYN